MENDTYILEELKEISPLLVQIEKTNVYSVSSYYFDSLSLKILDKVKTGVEPVYHFGNITPFIAPKGYFEELPGKILHKVQGKNENREEVFDEMEEISPLLNTISKKSVFNVPEGYFQKLQLQNNVIEKPEAKVVHFNNSGKRLMRYAVAAIVATLLAVGIFLISEKDGTNNTALSKNSKVEVNNLSEQEILEFLKTNPSPSEITSASFNTTIKEREIKNSLKEMTDKEIQQFLQENEAPDEI